MKKHWELVADLYDLSPKARERVAAYEQSQYIEVLREFHRVKAEMDTYPIKFIRWGDSQESEEL